MLNTSNSVNGLFTLSLVQVLNRMNQDSLATD